MNKLESCVVVTNPKGAVAHLHYENSKDSIILSSPKKESLYTLIDIHYEKVQKKNR